MLEMQSFISRWKRHREVLHKLVELDQNDLVQYKPWDGGMSYGELAIHIASTTEMFANTVIRGEFTPPQSKDEWATMEDVRNLVHRYTESTDSLLASVTEEQQQKVITFFGNTAPGYGILNMALDHEIHHKGQLFTYARMAGVTELPFFM
ncbi:DinB family protein [Paenibacillus sp. Marseille-Q4541]|uniref:DinB family protein n=1 Tax=Paenibacillus sp. Marseille-Q4541 TaxID=2831522 RepID=UPI001BA6D0E5|nr:DinB family protein [Paenibacillus sp. Marseille-Q4541]